MGCPVSLDPISYLYEIPYRLVKFYLTAHWSFWLPQTSFAGEGTYALMYSSAKCIVTIIEEKIYFQFYPKNGSNFLLPYIAL